MGRVANRIKDGEFTLDGKTYHLPKNDGTLRSCIMFNSFLHVQTQLIYLGALGILLCLFILGPVDDAGGKRGFDKVL